MKDPITIIFAMSESKWKYCSVSRWKYIFCIKAKQAGKVMSKSRALTTLVMNVRELQFPVSIIFFCYSVRRNLSFSELLKAIEKRRKLWTKHRKERVDGGKNVI